VFGGTFDPPHLGHLLAAVDAFEKLSLRRILIVPNYVQPLKADAQATAEQRLAMVRLMVGGDPRFEVEAGEVERKGMSYSVDTLEDLTRRYKGSQLYFLIGRDALRRFAHWRSPERIRQLATLVVVTRREEAADLAPGGIPGLAEGVPAGVMTVMTRTIDISSSEIRERVRLGRSIRGFVTPEVEAFIADNRLYRQVEK
jgi:nicotinate-nucleotide adenylyltransferase